MLWHSSSTAEEILEGFFYCVLSYQQRRTNQKFICSQINPEPSSCLCLHFLRIHLLSRADVMATVERHCTKAGEVNEADCCTRLKTVIKRNDLMKKKVMCWGKKAHFHHRQPQ